MQRARDVLRRSYHVTPTLYRMCSGPLTRPLPQRCLYLAFSSWCCDHHRGTFLTAACKMLLCVWSLQDCWLLLVVLLSDRCDCTVRGCIYNQDAAGSNSTCLRRLCRRQRWMHNDCAIYFPTFAAFRRPSSRGLQFQITTANEQMQENKP